MKTMEIEALESYFKTENEHYNGYTFEMICEVLKQDEFESPELPLQLFDTGTDLFLKHSDSPVKAVQLFSGEMDKQKLEPNQRLFIYKWICKYLAETEFEGKQLTQVNEILQAQKKKLKVESQPVKPLTMDIRETLKEMMQQELSRLPETLKELDAVQRLNVLCKLIPFVLPKVNSVSHELGEPDEFR